MINDETRYLNRIAVLEAQVTELSTELQQKKRHIEQLSAMCSSLAGVLRGLAYQHRIDGKLLQGLQGKCYALAEKLDDFALGILRSVNAPAPMTKQEENINAS